MKRKIITTQHTKLNTAKSKKIQKEIVSAIKKVTIPSGISTLK
jgi:hypothetical protein